MEGNPENLKNVKGLTEGAGLCEEESIRLMVTNLWLLSYDNLLFVHIVEILFGKLN